MAMFTMELREMMNSFDDIGLSDYPIFDENYRIPLNKKITDRYFFREIGLETPDMFKHYLNMVMCEIMPLYNQFYESERLKIDPLLTMDIKSLSDQTSDMESGVVSNSDSTTTNSAKARVVDSSTPQHVLSNEGDYASGSTDTISATDAGGVSEEKSDTTAKSKGTGSNSTKGISGNQSDMLNRYRQTFLNIDLDIIQTLDQRGLFMNIFTTGDDPFRKAGRFGIDTFYPTF